MKINSVSRCASLCLIAVLAAASAAARTVYDAGKALRQKYLWHHPDFRLIYTSDKVSLT